MWIVAEQIEVGQVQRDYCDVWVLFKPVPCGVQQFGWFGAAGGAYGALMALVTHATEHMRDAPPCAADSVVTSRLACGPIGTALVPVELTRRLLLCSDGVGKQLDAAIVSLNLGTAHDAVEAAHWLAADADVAGVDVQRTRSDNSSEPSQ